MTEKIKPKLVLVEWEDASVVDSDTWLEHAAAPAAEAVIFWQVGWLLADTPDAVVLTSTTDGNMIAARDRIPRGMVRRILELNPFDGVPLALPRKPRKRKDVV